jgi:hypothetical protein
MKAIEVRVPHAIGPEEARRRLDAAVTRARQEYASHVGEIDATWEAENRLRVLVSASGMRFDGTVDVMVEELVVNLQVPGMAALFSGRIREGIQERLGGLLGSQRA